MNLLYKSVFNHMRLSVKDLKLGNSKLQGFTGERKTSLGCINLTVEIEDAPHVAKRVQTFVIIDEFSTYNTFLIQPALSYFQVVISPWCLTMKFLIDRGVGVVMGDQR